MIANDQWFTDKRKRENLLNGICRNDIIYRIVTIGRFLELLDENANTLVKPSKWDDPFENFLFSANATDQYGHQIGLESLRDSYFGQCWSLHDESDAMWRIYAPNKDGVKIKTTVGKLFDEYYSAIPGPELKCYIGKVEYLVEDEIRRILGDDNLVHGYVFDSTGLTSVKSLLLKRTAFKHENEVRLIYATHEDSAKSEEVFKYAIDPNALIEEVVLDPRCDDSAIHEYSDLIISKGYSNPIQQSTLYKISNLNIRIMT